MQHHLLTPQPVEVLRTNNICEPNQTLFSAGAYKKFPALKSGLATRDYKLNCEVSPQTHATRYITPVQPI